MEYVEDMDKRSVLLDSLLSTDVLGLTLVFVEKKRMADTVRKLSWITLSATSIHGDRTQHGRERSLDSFRTGRTPIMVAMTVAARGLDIANVSHVISYDLPTDNLKIVEDFIDILKEANQPVPGILESLARETRSYSGHGRGGRGGFDCCDYRKYNGGGGNDAFYYPPRDVPMQYQNKTSWF